MIGPTETLLSRETGKELLLEVPQEREKELLLGLIVQHHGFPYPRLPDGVKQEGCDCRKGLAYSVRGVVGAKAFRDYGSMLRYNFPGAASCDGSLAALLGIERKPERAFGLLALKNVRGAPPRLGKDPIPKAIVR